MNKLDTIFTVGGVKFRITVWTYVFFGFCLLCSITTNMTPMLYIGSYLFLIGAHELGHFAVATWLRYETCEIWITPVLGFCICRAPEYELEEIAISWGGVAAQAVLFVAASIVLAAGGHLGEEIRLWLAVMFLGVNAVLVVTNLLPIPGLDGAIAWRVFPWARGPQGRKSRVSKPAPPALSEVERLKAEIHELLKSKKKE